MELGAFWIDNGDAPVGDDLLSLDPGHLRGAGVRLDSANASDSPRPLSWFGAHQDRHGGSRCLDWIRCRIWRTGNLSRDKGRCVRWSRSHVHCVLRGFSHVRADLLACSTKRQAFTCRLRVHSSGAPPQDGGTALSPTARPGSPIRPWDLLVLAVGIGGDNLDARPCANSRARNIGSSGSRRRLCSARAVVDAAGVDRCCHRCPAGDRSNSSSPAS